jgi:drug/metabolite transporter (DMT)-like permease
VGTVTLRPALLALGGAALFGLSVPAGKRLLADLPPPVLAGLLYLGSGLGLGAWRLGRGGALLRLPPGSWPTLLATAAAGGVAAPLCLMEGLRRSEGQAASVLLSLEAVFTAILAAALFREHVGRAAWGAVGLAAGAAILLAEPWAGTDRPDGVGLLLVALATAGWALDNNLSRRLSDRDPVQVAALKGLVAGPACLGVALLLGSPVPTDPLALGGAAAVGLLSYGLSLVLVLRAFAGLGAARTMAIFGAAPAFGAAGCWAFLGERPGPALLGAGALLAAGGWLLSRERHDHEHVHEAMEHEHPHRHDDGHHDHVHEGWEGPEPHVHRHRHAPLVHSHPHAPDLHHRHGHGGDHSQECRTFM